MSEILNMGKLINFKLKKSLTNPRDSLSQVLHIIPEDSVAKKKQLIIEDFSMCFTRRAVKVATAKIAIMTRKSILFWNIENAAPVFSQYVNSRMFGIITVFWE